MDTINSVSTTLDVISAGILDYALVLAAVGTITMALLELIKGLTAFRQHYHRQMIDNWIARAKEPEKIKSDSEDGVPYAELVLDELLTFAGGGEADKGVLFDQTSSKMMGQIQAAANISLDYPNTYPAMYNFFTTVAYSKKGEGKQNKHVIEDRNTWLSFFEENHAATPEEAQDKTKMASQARARLGNLVSRRLDAFQNRLEFYWARTNQFFAIVLGSLLLLVILIQSAMTVNLLLLILLSISGGLVAPFAKDVVSALTGLRTRRA